MNKSTSVLIIILSLVVGIMDGDCTFSAVITMFLLPGVFEIKNKRTRA